MRIHVLMLSAVLLATSLSAADDAGGEVKGMFSMPKVEWNFGSASSKTRQKKTGSLMAYVDLRLSTKKENFRTPVVRVCCLLRGENQKNTFVDLMFDEAGRPAKRCPPIRSYGEMSDGWQRSVGGNKRICFLEDLSSSCCQKPIPKNVNSLRQIYCADGRNRKSCVLIGAETRGVRDVEGLFKQPAVDVLCYRFECWQNGERVGVFASPIPSDIPKDWYKWQRHAAEFEKGPCPSL